MLACDYFGYNNCNWVDDYTGWKYASCTRFKGADKTSEIEPPQTKLWSLSDRYAKLESIKIQLYAAFTDMSVRSYTASKVMLVMVYNPGSGLDDTYGVYLPEERLF